MPIRPRYSQHVVNSRAVRGRLPKVNPVLGQRITYPVYGGPARAGLPDRGGPLVRNRGRGYPADAGGARGPPPTVSPTEQFHACARGLAFHGGFYGLRNFGCKTAQFLRNVARIGGHFLR